MPFFLAYIVATLPSGLGIYILTMNIVSIFQTIYINRKLAAEIKIKDAEDVNIKLTAEEPEKLDTEEKAKGMKIVAKKKKVTTAKKGKGKA